MVEKEKGYAFQQQVRKIAEKYNWQPSRLTPKKIEKTAEVPEAPASENKPWWKLW
jgi:hypothetical protein